MTPVRVLHVIGGNDTGGAMSYLLPLLGALREQGCDAHLLCLGAGGLVHAAVTRGLPHTVIPMSHPWDARPLAPLRRFLTAEAWQVVHTHGMRASLPVRMVLPSVRPRPLLFTTIHSDLGLDYPNPLKSRVYGLLDRGTRAGVDTFCCVSGDLARRLVARGVSEARVHVVHPGLESDVLQATGALSAERRAGATIGTVARLVPVKDLALLLDAVAIVSRTVPGVRAVIVGDGPDRKALERRAAEPDLSGRVEFLGTVRPAWPALAQFDVYGSSSQSEGIPISVLEAMAASLPVVATAVGGLPETVRDGVSGYLVKRGVDRHVTAAALAGRLTELLGDPGTRRRMGAAGRGLVVEHFSAQAAGRTMLGLYERALGGGRVLEGVTPGPTTTGSPWPALSILGFRLDLVDLEQAAQWAVRTAAGVSAEGGARATEPGRTAIAVSFNPELVVRAQDDPAAAAALRSADLSYPDGVGAVWAARRGLTPGAAAVARLAGIDLAQRVLELAAAAGLSVYFLGAKPGVAEEAARRQKASLPDLRIAGCADGYFGPADEAAVVAQVRQAGADILFVAMGAPRQETLLHDHRDEWGVRVALGIGGSFDVWAGNVTRAPGWVRKAGVEWLYRLAREPWRLRRQMALPLFAMRVVRRGRA